jgi:hypothetical protein
VEQVTRGARRGAGDVVGTGGVPVGVLADQVVINIRNRVAAADAAPDIFLMINIILGKLGRFVDFQ